MARNLPDWRIRLVWEVREDHILALRAVRSSDENRVVLGARDLTRDPVTEHASADRLSAYDYLCVSDGCDLRLFFGAERREYGRLLPPSQAGPCLTLAAPRLSGRTHSGPT